MRKGTLTALATRRMGVMSKLVECSSSDDRWALCDSKQYNTLAHAHTHTLRKS